MNVGVQVNDITKYNLRQREGPIFHLTLNCDGTEQTLANCSSAFYPWQYGGSFHYWIKCQRTSECQIGHRERERETTLEVLMKVYLLL